VPRGTKTVEIVSPVEGTRFDLPAHKLSPAMLAAGSYNVFCDQTDMLRVRSGYSLLADSKAGQRFTGGISWVGVNGAVRTVVAGLNRWWSYSGGATGTITELSGNLSGSADHFTEFAVIFVNGTDTLYAVDGQNGLISWTPGSASITQVGGLPFENAIDIFVLANRLVVVGTTESGVFYPNRVRWSAFNNPTSFPVQAVADLVDPGSGIAAAARLGNLSAYIYMEQNLWQMNAQVGDDANAFAFQEFALGEGVVGPASTAAIVAIEGTHYFLGNDGRIWTFNGLAPQNFGIPIQSYVLDNINFANIGRSFAFYSPSGRHARFHFPTTGSDPDQAVYYSLDFNRWEPPAKYQQAFTCGFSGPFGGATSTYRPTAFVGDGVGKFYEYDTDTGDNGAQIPFTAVWGPRSTASLEKMQIQAVEAFVEPSSAKDILTFRVYGLRTPIGNIEDLSPAYLMSYKESDFQVISAPGVDAPGSTFYNWIQVALSGTSPGSLAFIGAYVQVNVVNKGVYNLTGEGVE